jgi:dTDP-glucose 4,6-dehydratase
MRRLTNLLVTGGAGFIGSNFIRTILSVPDFKGCVVNVDKLTYAANPGNLHAVEKRVGGSRYFFEKADIGDFKAMSRIFKKYATDTVVHFAAESHVDRSILGPDVFVQTNIVGTSVLEGLIGPSCPSLPSHLRLSRDGVQLLQQLRGVSVPGEDDSLHDTERLR